MEGRVRAELDKYMENLFRFNSVLPGAYSIFRFDAIIGSPIKEFYKGLDKISHYCAEANQYLAEDRIMCLEVVIRSDRNYYISCVPDAEAFTDYVITRDATRIPSMKADGSVRAARYVILCNSMGGVLNDPILLRVAEDEFWFSLSDSFIGFYLPGVNPDQSFVVDIAVIDVCPVHIGRASCTERP